MSKQVDSIVLATIYAMVNDDYSIHVAKLTTDSYFIAVCLGNNLIMADTYTHKEEVVDAASDYFFNLMGLEDWLNL